MLKSGGRSSRNFARGIVGGEGRASVLPTRKKRGTPPSQKPRASTARRREPTFPKLKSELSFHVFAPKGRRMTPVESFIRRENIKNFKKRLEAPTDDAQRKMLLTLLAEEKTKTEQLLGKVADLG
jgi:hypothetical protein